MSIDHCSPLFQAILTHDQIKLQDLLEHTGKLEVLNEQGKSPLILASEVGDLTSVERLLSKGASINPFLRDYP